MHYKVISCMLFILVLLLLGCQPKSIDTDPQEVSLNGLALRTPDAKSYQFLVIGHSYGAVEIDDGLPSQNLLNNLDKLKPINLSMLVSLGDMVMHSRADEFDLLDKNLLSALPFPIFNVPGNHDVEDRALYEKRFGKTYYTFRYGPARLIFLDTEIKTCQINTAQQEMLAKALAKGLRDRDTHSILIFLHKTLFFQNDYLFSRQKNWAMPNVWSCYNATNFKRIMEEKILPAAKKKPVYLFAGDVGAWGNLSPYYERREDIPLTMVMTGIGDQATDSGILVTVGPKDVQLQAYSLTGQDLPALETFNADYWNLKAAQDR